MTDGSTENYWLALRRLERSAVKVACCVLRGAGRSNAVRLLDKPDIRKQTTGTDAIDPKHSSEADRKKRGDQKPRAKKPKRKIPLRSIDGSIVTLVKIACHLMQSSKGMRPG